MNTKTIINLDGILAGLKREIRTLRNLVQTLISNSSSTPTASYLVYTALMSQTGTSAPTVIVLENTIGNIVWTRQSTGNYIGTLANAFPADKTFCFGVPGSYDGSAIDLFSFTRESDSESRVHLYLQFEGTTIDLNDGGSHETSIEIRVYP